MAIFVQTDELTTLVAAALAASGASAAVASELAHAIVAAERDGTPGHGLLRLPGYLSTLKSGWVDGRAVPELRDSGGALIVADAGNGFAQSALTMGRSVLDARARQLGMAALAIHNSHNFGALWLHVEPFAENGLIALAFLNSRSHIVPWGGKKKILGTNPIAFACPRRSGPPMVWDQAASGMSMGDVIIAAKEGRRLPPGIGVDASGKETDDPAAVLDGGALLPFGQHKGHNLALMVEILAAGLTGSRFGYEDASKQIPGALTSNAGELLIVIDPLYVSQNAFFERTEDLFSRLVDDAGARMPGDRRYERRRRAIAEGIAVPEETLAALRAHAKP